MSETIRVTITPNHIRMEPGKPETATVIVRNLTDETEQYQLSVEGGRSGWAKIGPDQVGAFAYGPSDEAQLEILVPVGEPPATYNLAVKATSQRRAGIEGRGVIEVEVPPVPGGVIEPQPIPISNGPGERGLGPEQPKISKILVTPVPVTNPPVPEPGAQWRLSLKNDGNVLDIFTFRFNKISAGWISIDPVQVTLQPGEESTALLTVQPDDGAPAGIYRFTLSTFSNLNLKQQTEFPLQIEVKPRREFSLSLSQHEIETEGVCAFTIFLASAESNNADFWLDLSASDQGNACEYTFEPSSLELLARQTATTTLRVRPRAVLGPTDRRSYSVKVAATPRDPALKPLTDEVRISHIGPRPLRLELSPQQKSGDLSADYLVNMINPSTADAQVRLKAEDPEHGCTYAFEPFSLTVPANSQAQVKLAVSARDYIDIKAGKIYPFKVTATREGELLPSGQTDGQFQQRPIDPATLLLSPPQKRSSGSASYDLRITNPRTSPVLVSLTAQDDAAALSYNIKPQQLNLSPTAEGRARVKVKPLDSLQDNEKRHAHRFTVSGQVGALAPVVVTGTLVQVRWFDPVMIIRGVIWAVKWGIFIALMAFLLTMAAEGFVLLTVQKPDFGASWASYDSDRRLQEIVKLSPIRVQVRNVLCNFEKSFGDPSLNCLGALQEITR